MNFNVSRRKALWVGIPLGLLLLGLIVALLIWWQLPSLDRLTDYQPKLPLRILAADGQLLGEFGAERRKLVPIADIPKPMRDALVAVEDADFWTHPGIDLGGILRAAVRNLTHSGPLHGGSTLTQQLARDMYLTKEQTWSRKITEAVLAYKIEQTLSKDEILEIYMNQIWLGGRTYGFAAAAQRYFGKELSELDLGEMALLIGLPKNPAGYNPHTRLLRAKKRQAVVLARLVAVGQITQEQADAAKAAPLHLRRVGRLSSIADHAMEQVRAEVVARYGPEAYERGLQVTTTLYAAEQEAAQQALRHALFDLERRQPYRGPEGRIELPAEGYDDELDRAFAQWPDLGELRTAVLLKLQGSDSAELALSDGQLVTLKGGAARPLAKLQRVVRVAQALKDYGLENRASHRPDELSGGQRQRVAIARATVMQPAVILADEPTGNLDRGTGEEVVRLLETLNTQGVTLVVVTHDAQLGARARRQLLMEDGAVRHDSAA